MQDDEIPNTLVLGDQLGVVRVDVPLVEGLVGEVLEQMEYPAGDQMDAGRFQGLQKAGGQAQGDAVAVPIELASTRHEAQETGLGHGLLAGSAQQILERLFVAAMLTGVDVTVAATVLQRYLPLPACTARQ